MSTFSELAASHVITYSDGYRTKNDQLASSGYTILRAADVHHGWVTFNGKDHVDTSFKRQIGRKVAREGDLVLTTKGTIGRVAMVTGLGEQRVVYSPQLCFFRVLDGARLHAPYLRYWFSSPTAQQQIAVYSGNTDMAPYLSLRDIGSINLPLPPLDHQYAIAQVLGALDDKIAANRRVVNTGLNLFDSTYTATPKTRGQEVFSEVAILGGGGTPSTKDDSLWEGTLRWATPTDITGLTGPWLLDTARHISQAGLERITSKLYPRGTIFMSSRASIGYCALSAGPAAVNQGFIAVQPKDDRHLGWLFAQMRQRTTEFVAWANGATFLELPKGVFRSLPVEMALDHDLKRFQQITDPVLDRLEAAQRESKSLATTRDELLPLLMTGKISVKNAERRIEQEA